MSRKQELWELQANNCPEILQNTLKCKVYYCFQISRESSTYNKNMQYEFSFKSLHVYKHFV